MPRKKLTENDELLLEESEETQYETETTEEESNEYNGNGELFDGANSNTTEKTKTQIQKPQEHYQDILTVDNDDTITSKEEIENTNWHEIRNAYNTRKILTGKLDGIETTETGVPLAIVTFKSYRIVIPIKEMNINLSENRSTGTILNRQSRILGNMIGADVDFVIKGIDNKERSVVASRKDAMLRKQKRFYIDLDNGKPKINEGQVVQARITAVSEKAIRVDVFGVETSIWANELSHDWLSDARDKFNIGDKTIVKVQKINIDENEDIKITASIKAIEENYSDKNLEKCKVQGKYSGTITEIKNGIVFIRLNIDVNAIAHSCMDKRTPGKNDVISFVVTKIDYERNVAVGLINRIIKQNF